MKKWESSSAPSQFFAEGSEFLSRLKQLAKSLSLYGPDQNSRLKRFRADQVRQIVFNPSRMLDPLKAIFFPARSGLGTPFADDHARGREIPARIIIGAKACDLAALELLDRIFLEGEFPDEEYRGQRQKTLIISSDCEEPSEFCFCAALGGSPYPVSGFDLNLTPAPGGWLLEAGTEKGRELLAESGFRAATEEERAHREKLRAEKSGKLQERLLAEGFKFEAAQLQKVIESATQSPLWRRLSEKCVECAACSFICPTCHCFLLSDRGHAPDFLRSRAWDSCSYRDFARLGSGANPRPRRAQRLRNRFEKKFCFFPSELGRPGCVGCGRCIEACAGGLDLRRTLKELSVG